MRNGLPNKAERNDARRLFVRMIENAGGRGDGKNHRVKVVLATCHIPMHGFKTWSAGYVDDELVSGTTPLPCSQLPTMHECNVFAPAFECGKEWVKGKDDLR